MKAEVGQPAGTTTKTPTAADLQAEIVTSRETAASQPHQTLTRPSPSDNQDLNQEIHHK